MKNKSLYILVGIVATVLIAAVAAIAYTIGKGQSEGELNAMAKEVATLRAGEKKAAVVKRVSQQMEEIAYQQKEISDKQRIKAEESSKLAIEMRDRAEQESHLARTAEQKAIEALQEAENQRSNAMQQQRIAVEERDKATLSKTIADTLNRRTVAKTLGLTSINKREGGDEETADLLAYASWYLLDKYEGNTYYAETFKALALATGGMERTILQQRGVVNALSIVPNGKGNCVAVSNYGEIELLSSPSETRQQTPRRLSSTVLLQNNIYDFRDVWAGKNAVYALSFKGPLCVVSYEGKMKTVALPADSYFKLIHTDSNTLLIAGRKSLCWYTFSTGDVSAPVRLPKTLTTIVKRENNICLFYDDDTYAEMDGTGKITEKKPLTRRSVATAHYAPDLECLFLGLKDGTVQMVNKYNRIAEDLEAHNAKTVCITTIGPVMITGAYDKAAYIWKLDNLVFSNTGLNFWQEMQTKVAPVAKVSQMVNQVPKEWISPVEYTFQGWTLAVCGDPATQHVWIGTSRGEVVRINCSVDNMAKKVYGALKRNLTPVEWSHYLGVSVPYVKLKGEK